MVLAATTLYSPNSLLTLSENRWALCLSPHYYDTSKTLQDLIKKTGLRVQREGIQTLGTGKVQDHPTT
jgi:hypothetical protein